MSTIYWILVSSRATPSSRIHGLRIHEYLMRRGWRSKILFAPLHWMSDPPLDASDFLDRQAFRPGDVVVCQKLQGPNTRSILAGLRSLGVACIYVDCDLPLHIEEACLTTMTICSSDYLANEYSMAGIGTVRSIPDAYEWSVQPAARPTPQQLQCVWFANSTPEKWDEFRKLRDLVSATLRNWRLIGISDNRAADVKWDVGTAWKVMSECDAVVLPGSGDSSALAKSSNRAVQAMALGLPPIAYPIPAYQGIIRSNRNGFLCRTDHEWISAFRALEDPVHRLRIARCGYRYARRYFSIDRIGKLWEGAIADCGAGPAQEDNSSAPFGDIRNIQEVAYARASLILKNRLCFG